MPDVLWPWIKFALCAAVIGLAGPVLTRSGDIIAQKTGVSRTWIGLVLLATATSLPELVAGLSAVTAAAAPNIAVGNVLGSCLFNLGMLAVVDVLHRPEPMYRRMDQGHILSAGFGVVLIGIVGASLLLGRDGSTLQIAHVGAYTPILVVLYLVGMRTAFVYERRQSTLVPAKAAERGPTLAQAILRYAVAAAFIAGAASWLPFIGVDIAEVMGWRTTFVGTLFISAATTLPEFVVTVSALRMGALDLAIANLLGSNLFDVLILAIDDLAYTRGPLLSDVSPAHAVSAFAVVIMSGIVIVALLYRPDRRFFGTIGWVSLSLLMVYIFTSYAIYLHGH